MMKPRLLIFLMVWGCGVSGDDQEETREDLLTTPVISSVRTADGFRQVRQGDQVPLVIRGHGLDQTTAVVIATMFVTLDVVTEREVQATLFSDTSTPLGLLDVTLTSPAGDTTATGALRLTPYVVSPTATTGHGTYQSPMSLCDPALQLTNGVIVLLPGTHACGGFLELSGGVTIEGDRQSPTIVTGTADSPFAIAIEGSNPASVSTVRDVTFAPPLFSASLSMNLGAGALVVERVTDAAGILASDGAVTLDRYRFDGAGTGATLGQGTVTRSTFRHCDQGIVATGRVIVEDVTVEGCDRGLVATAGGGLEIHHARLIDNRIGLAIEADANRSEHIQSVIEDSVIRDDTSTPATCLIGIGQSGENLTANRLTITGQANGILVSQNDSSDSADFAGDSLEVVGGVTGVAIDGIENSLQLHNSTVRGQSAASVSIGALDSFVDISNNVLQVRRGGFAIVNDRRFDSFFSRYVIATGTTLNGVSFNGSVLEGPLTLPPYLQIVDGDSGFIF